MLRGQSYDRPYSALEKAHPALALPNFRKQLLLVWTPAKPATVAMNPCQKSFEGRVVNKRWLDMGTSCFRIVN